MQKRILVVAHAADVVETIPITLGLAGHKVALADCGLDAILWADRVRPDLILVDANLPDMDGSTIIRILQRLPSTVALPTLLLKPRWHNAWAQIRGGWSETGSLNSSELLRQVALVLTLCHSADPEVAQAHETEAFSDVRVFMASESEFASQTA
jgi:DNA-binding response OmpR family regulator